MVLLLTCICLYGCAKSAWAFPRSLQGGVVAKLAMAMDFPNQESCALGAAKVGIPDTPQKSGDGTPQAGQNPAKEADLRPGGTIA